MKVLMLCSMGMSTGMLCDRIKAAADAQGVELTIWAASEINARENVGEADIVLLGPQVKYIKDRIVDMVENKIPVMVIDMVAYGTMNGEKVFADVQACMEEWEHD